MKNALERIGNRADNVEERISELKDRNLKMIQVEEERELRFFLKMKKFYKNYLIPSEKSTIRIAGIPEKEERETGVESLFKKIIAENFPNLRKELEIQVHEANRTPNYLNAKRPSPRHIILKLSKVNDKERVLKAVREKKDSNLQRYSH